MRVFEVTLDNGLVDNMTAGFTTGSPVLAHSLGYSIAATWSGASVAGVLKLQASLASENAADELWADITGSSVTLSQTSGIVIWDVPAARYPYVRVKYAPSAGTGKMTVLAYSKGL